MPDHVLDQNTCDDARWLWTVVHGVKFIESVESVTASDGWNDEEKPKLLGP